ncbi:MAG: nitrilase-related carbon-nitrogen hydrolase [Candidatus Hydrogenedentota bacterium]
MKIALIQERLASSVEETIVLNVRAAREAGKSGAKLIAFAELAFWPFFPQQRRDGRPAPHAETIPGPTTDRFAAIARECGAVIVLNLYEKDGDRSYDSSPVIDSDGQIKGVARMMHIMDGPCFHEQDYYDPGDRGALVCDTAAGRIGVAICYDRHYPEYMRALGVQGAQLVVIPQAGVADEWPGGLYEAEVQVAAMQNGYFAALVNRVGQDGDLLFAGESFVTDPMGRMMTRAPRGEDGILYADIDYALLDSCPARRHFLRDRRPDIYPLA